MATAKKEEKKGIKTALVAGTKQTLSNLFRDFRYLCTELKGNKLAAVLRYSWNLSTILYMIKKCQNLYMIKKCQKQGSFQIFMLNEHTATKKWVCLILSLAIFYACKLILQSLSACARLQNFQQKTQFDEFSSMENYKTMLLINTFNKLPIWRTPGLLTILPGERES